MRGREPLRLDRAREDRLFVRLFLVARFGFGAFVSLVPPSSVGAAGGGVVSAGGGMDSAGGAGACGGGLVVSAGGAGDGGGVGEEGGVGSDGGGGASPVTTPATSPTSAAQGLSLLKR